MLQKFFLFFWVVLFCSLSQASDVEDYVNNIIESALNKNIRASSYFLSEIDRLEDAGADFVHSERMCRLKYLDDLFEIYTSFGQERPIIQKTIDEIDHNIVGHNLIESLSRDFSIYHIGIMNELIKKKKIELDDEKESVIILKNYNKLFLRKANKTLFSPGSPIPTNNDYWANDLNKYTKYFQLIIDIKDCKDTTISILNLGDNETVMDKSTTFTSILFHELVHVLDFLEDSRSYRINNAPINFEHSLNVLWPSFAEKNDGMKLQRAWDGRITEVKAVIGGEFHEEMQEININMFSELSFSMSKNDQVIRFPYMNSQTVIHRETSSALFDNGINYCKLLEKKNN